MSDQAADSLARALCERGERVVSANGALPATRRFLEEMARLTGGHVEVAQHTRLFELGELAPARPVPGRLRLATLDEVDLVLAWFEAFMADADEQAGRVRGASNPAEVPDREGIERRIERGRTWLWEDEAGSPVHLTAANAPGFGVCRIGPVYTPPAERGRGWASAAVAEVSRLVLEEGNRACLFTDQANPTSNGIYQALGYRPVVDMANLVIADEA
jgi:predicted GNAT family acetyltransferase